MHVILTSLADGVRWVANTLDALLDDAIIGFGAAAPLATQDDGRPVEGP